MRKLLCCLAALLLSASVIAGCSNGGDETSNSAATESAAATTTALQSTTETADSETDSPVTTLTDLTTETQTVSTAAPATSAVTPESSASTEAATESQTPVTTLTPETTSSPVTETPVTSETPTTSKESTTTNAPVTNTPTTTKPPVTTQPPVTTAPPVTETPSNEPAKGTKITVRYATENSKYGTLSGSSYQTIRYGETKTSTVTAKAAVGYKFVGWSDGVKTATRSGDSPTENTKYTALFEIAPLELPVVHITTETGSEVTSKEEYINGTIAISNCDEKYVLETMDMEIRGRGNFTWGLAKKSYRVKLSKKQNLLGQGSGKAKVWTLIANHCDQSLLRNYTTLHYGQKLDGIAFMSSATSVDLYYNGEYRGVYLLCEQMQVNEERVNVTEAPESVNTGYLIEMTGYAEDPRFEMFLESGWFNFEIKNDLSTNASTFNQQVRKAQSIMEDAWAAVQSGDRARIEAAIDIDSAIDTYIVEELFKNLDAGWDSFYFYYDAAVSGEKLHFGPIWDFDLSGGNVNEGTDCDLYTGLHAGTVGCNPWYGVLLRQGWFRQLVADRWNELKSETDKIPGDIIAAAKAGYNAYCRNFEKWQIFGQQINREPAVIRELDTYTEHYEYYSEWMANRIAWLDSYFNSEEYTFNGTLTLKGSGTKSNPYQVTSAKDFLNFTLCMKNGEIFSGKYFKQTADLDLTKLSGYTGAGASATFAGVYDGAGHKIKAVLSGNDECIFPYVTGTVMNLMTEGSISNGAQAAGICRSVRIGGVIVNCASTMTVSGSYAGGIAASNQGGGGMILNCYFAGSVEGWEAASPINCYAWDRGGTYENNYYLNTVTHTTADQMQSGEETALSRSDMTSKLAGYLNDSLSESASIAGVSASDLCRWKTVTGGNPVLTAK